MAAPQAEQREPTPSVVEHGRRHAATGSKREEARAHPHDAATAFLGLSSQDGQGCYNTCVANKIKPYPKASLGFSMQLLRMRHRIDTDLP